MKIEDLNQEAKEAKIEACNFFNIDDEVKNHDDVVAIIILMLLRRLEHLEGRNDH